MKSIRWDVVRDSILLLGILTFSLPLKTPAIQSFLESILQISFPIQLSTYTLFLPMWLGITVLIHLLRIPEVWNQLKIPLLLMAMLFVWMWLGAWFSEWRGHSLKHAGRYSIHFFVFLVLLILVQKKFAVSAVKIFLCWFLLLSFWVFINVYFLEEFENWRINKVLNSLGILLELFESSPYSALGMTGFFENRNPHASVAVFVVFLGGFALWQRYWIIGISGLFCGLWIILIAGSRNAFLGLVFFFIVCSIAIYKKFSYVRLHKLALGMLITITFSVVLINIIPNHTKDRFVSKFQSIATIEDYEDLEKREVRFLFYRIALQVGMNDFSTFGSGPKSSGYVMAQNAPPAWKSVLSENKEIFNIHNAPLTVLIEMGWVGLGLALLFLIVWFHRSRGCPLFIFGAGMALCILQLFDYFIWQITFMTVQSFAFALMAASSNYRASKDQ